MQIEVRLFATFRKGRFNRCVMDLAEGTSLREVLVQIGIPAEEVSLPLVNGEFSPLDRKIVPGDVVSFFPAVGGG